MGSAVRVGMKEPPAVMLLLKEEDREVLEGGGEGAEETLSW